MLADGKHSWEVLAARADGAMRSDGVTADEMRVEEGHVIFSNIVDGKRVDVAAFAPGKWWGVRCKS